MRSTPSNKSILLIEDQASVQELVKTCLSGLAGWNIVVVSSAQAGLRCVAGKHPDVILLDFLTPGMDAKTFMHKLHSDPLTASIPVILLSARARWFTPLQLQQLGVVAAIAKPFNPMTLPDKIADALGWSWQTEI
ncbi:response regulator [Trichocoleus desertorum AS-A10]|uniref:response regulator n=1 Tax=Trichocoleus desertorum TaxID=1481672 RepID=UPI003296F7C4